MGTRITIMGARLSYPHLFQPRQVDPNSPPKYGCVLLIPKDSPVIGQLQKAADAEAGARWGANKPASLKPLPLHDCATHPSYSNQPELHGYMALSANAKDKPFTVDQNVQPSLNQGMFYAGCFVNADVGIFAYDAPMSKGIAAGLNGVQFVVDGERIDGRPSVDSMFQPVAGAPAPIAPGVADAPAADAVLGQPLPGAVQPLGQPLSGVVQPTQQPVMGAGQGVAQQPAQQPAQVAPVSGVQPTAAPVAPEQSGVQATPAALQHPFFS